MRAAESTRNEAQCHRSNRRPSPTWAASVLILFLAGCALVGLSEHGAGTNAPTLGLDGGATAASQPPQREADDAVVPTGSPDRETVWQSTAADAGPDGDATMQRREADLVSDDAILRALATVRPDAGGGGGAPRWGGPVALEPAPEPVRGRPADVHTKPGRYPGYAVWFGCPQKSGDSLVILWGLGTVPLPDLESEKEEYWRLANAALRVAGGWPAYCTAGNGACFCLPNRTIALLLDDFRDVDAAIRNLGAGLARERYVGQVVLELWPRPRPGQHKRPI